MPTPLILPTLAQALRDLGNAHVYWAAAFPTTAGAWSPLGQKAGPIGVTFNRTKKVLKATELTGDTPHKITIIGAAPIVTMPLIMGDEALLPIISPTGSAHGGSSFPQPTIEICLLIAPDEEIAGGLAYPDGTTPWTRTAGNGYLGATGAGAAPKNSLFFWKGVLSGLDSLSYEANSENPVVSTITFESIFDTARSEGQKLWTHGDPIASGLTTFRM